MVDSGIAVSQEICKRCERLTITEVEEAQNLTNEKCSQWLERYASDDCESLFGSESSCASQSTRDSDVVVGNAIINPCKIDGDLSILTNAKNSYKNVSITNSKNIHLGNITYINGPVYMNQSSTVVNQQTTVNQFFVEHNGKDVSKPRILNRTSWLAQPPMSEPEYIEGPARYVVVCHTATEEAFTEPDNILQVRLIQQFHIESRKWDDIAYNFLIGADGNVYEGRGWGVIGAHTYGFNDVCLGFAFIGCYMNKLPTEAAILTAKKLIEYGVQIGAIAENYSLLGHRQLATTESPGSKLYEELKTWKHYDPTISSNSIIK